MLVMAALAGLAVGVGLVVFTSDTAAESQPDLASMDQVPLETAPAPIDPATEASEPTGADTPSEPATAGTPSETGQTVSLDTCMRAAGGADDAVAAAATSLKNWKTHYGAQVAFDEGKIDGDEAKRRWVVSKEPAERNIDAFRDAREAMADDDPCDELDLGQMADGDRQEAEGCAARMIAAKDVVTQSQPAFDDWLAHLKMMATKDEYSLDEYLEIWRKAVADAPDAMQTFEEALGAYTDAGDCPTTTALDDQPTTATRVAVTFEPERGGVHNLTCILAPARSRSAQVST